MIKWPTMVAGLVLLLRSAPASAPPAPGPPTGPYEVNFVKSFPEVAGAHEVVDWDLYSALVSGDVVRYATRIDPAVALRFEGMSGKPYQIQRLESDIKQDKHLRDTFDQHRRRIASMTLTVDGNGTPSEPCRHSLVYLSTEFRLVLGQVQSGEDPLTSSTVAPRCRQTPEQGFQITAGRSSRFKCWTTTDSAKSCGWGLADMPVDLKRDIENEYPTTIRVRWTWRGLGGVARLRNLDRNGNRVAERDGITLTVPGNLGLEFVDDAGRIRWTAASVGARPQADPARR